MDFVAFGAVSLGRGKWGGAVVGKLSDPHGNPKFVFWVLVRLCFLVTLVHQVTVTCWPYCQSLRLEKVLKEVVTASSPSSHPLPFSGVLLALPILLHPPAPRSHHSDPILPQGTWRPSATLYSTQGQPAGVLERKTQALLHGSIPCAYCVVATPRGLFPQAKKENQAKALSLCFPFNLSTRPPAPASDVGLNWTGDFGPRITTKPFPLSTVF